MAQRLALDGFLRLSKTVQAWAPFVTLELQVGREGREGGKEGRVRGTNMEEKAQQAKNHIFITTSTLTLSFLPSSFLPPIPRSLFTAGGRCRGRAQGSDKANVRVAAQRAPRMEPLREGGKEGGIEGLKRKEPK